LPEESKTEITLEISDAAGKLIPSESDPEPNPEFPYYFMGEYRGDRKLSKNAGLSHFVYSSKARIVESSEHRLLQSDG